MPLFSLSQPLHDKRRLLNTLIVIVGAAVLVASCTFLAQGSKRVVVVPRPLTGTKSVRVVMESQNDTVREEASTRIVKSAQVPERSFESRTERRAISESTTDSVISPQSETNGTMLADNVDLLQFRNELMDHIRKFRHYPDSARAKQIQGVVLLQFSLSRDGAVLEVWVEQSSGSPVLDQEAIDTIVRSQPMPALPSQLGDLQNISMPMAFTLT